ncbi:AMP-binding protein [Nocardioides conyzicola]|uniref:AMP-binding protein n=1 Tax=Nocardioides conyzicola TaxID=1651781 RepID=A0ABP8XVP9_9ACTN
MIVPFSVADFIDRAVQVYGERVGVVDEPDQPAPPLGGGELTYAEIGALAKRLAARLDELGLEVGDRVAIVSHNSARLLTAFFGVSGWGRVLVPVNFRLSPDEVRYIVSHSGARVLLVDPELESTLRGVEAEFKWVLGDDDKLYAAEGTEPQAWEPDENATACINYTSGTTARPKGVQITHRNVWVNAVTFAMHATVSDRDVYLHTLPMFHANGWGMPYAMTGLGAKHIVLRKIDGAEILRRVRDHGVTVMCAAPAVAAAVLEAAQTWEGEIPGRDTVRIIMAGAPPPTKTVARVQEELGWEFIQIYGLTETSPLLTFNRTRAEWDDLDAEERAARLTRAGAPALGVRLAISEEPENEGEVLARSNVVLEGYWEQPEESARALAGGWFHTGDGGVIGDDGYLTISDRKKDVIITGGENVSSIEVEDVIFSHPAVAEVAVIGIPSEKWGETIMALVVLAEGEQVTEAELIAWCKERAAGYKAPTVIEFREDLARTATGKLQKFKLREPYWKDRDRQVN